MIQLSPRQSEILGLVVQGQANKMIARQLMVSEKTVKNQLTIMYRKLNVQSRTQAAIWALRQNPG
ncbi:MAG TPA: response regulator transcription factor [Anaerolineae bacterium]